MEKEEIYQQLNACIEANDYGRWNKFRRVNALNQIDCGSLDLSNKTLTKFNMTGVNFIKANLSQVIFDKCILNNARIKESECFGAHFIGCSMVAMECTKTNLAMAKFEKCDIRFSNFSESKIHQVCMYECQVNNSNLKNVSFNDTTLRNSDFHFSDISSAEFSKVELHDANFEAAIVDGKTIIWDCYYNKMTNFTGVGLSSCRVEPVLMSSFQCNIRRIWWNQWYVEKMNDNKVNFKFDIRDLWGNIKNITKYIFNALMTSIVKLFWWMTDYGSSTVRLLLVFLMSTAIYTGIYVIFPSLTNDIVLNHSPHIWLRIARGIYFSIVVNTGLGFGEINASENNIIGHFVISSHSLLGFVLLGAFLVRIGILFQGEFPVASSREQDSSTRN